MYKTNHTLTILLVMFFAFGKNLAAKEIDSTKVETVVLDRIVLDNDTLNFRPPIEILPADLISILTPHLDSYKEKGFLYPSIRLLSFQQREKFATLHYSVVPGPVFMFERLEFTGLHRSDPDLISRYLPMPDSAPLTNTTLTQLERAAGDIPHLIFKPPVEIVSDQAYQSGRVRLRFREKRTLLFEGSGGIEGADTRRAVWLINATFTNLFGRGREVKILSDYREKNKQILSLTYRQPFFLLGLGDLSFGVENREYKNVFSEFSATIGTSLRLSDNISIAWRNSYRTVTAVNPSPDYSTYSTGLEFLFGRQNGNTLKRQGWDIATSIDFQYRSYASDSLNGNRTLTETKSKLLVNRYQQIFSSVIFKGYFQYQGLESSEALLPQSELFFVGGPTTLRSYDTDQFTALRFAVVGFEPQVHFKGGCLFGFVEEGYLNNRIPVQTEVVSEELFRTGFGLGMRLLSGNRQLEISFGWNEDLSFDTPRLMIKLAGGI